MLYLARKRGDLKKLSKGYVTLGMTSKGWGRCLAM
jgi:hypothetical protein